MSQMSAVVIDRIRQRRRDRISLAIMAVIVSGVLCCLVLSTYWIHKRYVAVKSMMPPAWSNFQISGDAVERVSAKTPDGIPSILLINGQEWHVERVMAFNDALKYKGSGKSFSGIQAETYCKEKTIVYIETDDINVLKINIMHEIFHAGDCLHGGDTYWNSEHPTSSVHPGIYHLGEFTAVFLKDNPEFALWMTQ